MDALLGRLLQADRDEARGRRDLAGVLQERDGELDFAGGQGFERMLDGWPWHASSGSW